MDRSGKYIYFLPYLFILPRHVSMEFRDEVIRIMVFVLTILSPIVSDVKLQELLHIVVAVLIIEVDDKGDGSNGKELYLLSLAVNLQILDKVILSAYLLVKFEVIDDLLLCVAPHLLVVYPIFIKDPFEVRHSLPVLDLFPYFPLVHYGSDQIFVIIA